MQTGHLSKGGGVSMRQDLANWYWHAHAYSYFLCHIWKKCTVTHLANWKMSKTNFSILMPFGFSGLISWPWASTYGIFFWATWCCSWGSYFLMWKRGKNVSLRWCKAERIWNVMITVFIALPYCTMSLRKEKLKKWLATFAALNIRRPSALRFSAVARVISLYSTTW